MKLFFQGFIETTEENASANMAEVASAVDCVGGNVVFFEEDEVDGADCCSDNDNSCSCEDCDCEPK